ncbi:MAG: LamG domain-containing protein, partial [Blastocatellia bacterium]
GQPSATINVQISEQAPLVAEPDTLLLWHLDETGNGAVNIADSGPLAITGTASGNSTAAPGRFGGGRTRAAIVAGSDFGAFDFKNSSFSLECWVNTQPVGRTFTLVGRDDGSGTTNDFALQLFPSGGLQGYAIDTAGILATTVMPGTVFNVDDGQWHYLVMVVDRNANQLVLYVDGQLAASSSLPAGFGSLRNQGQTLKAGHFVNSAPSSFGGPLEFTGVLDDVRVSSTAHTLNQVQQDFGGSTLLEATSCSPSLIPRNKSAQQPTVTPVVVTGFNLDGITAQLLRNGQSFGATVSISSSSYRQANLTVTVPPATALGPAQIVLSKPGQTDVPITVQIAEQSPFVSSSDTLLLWHLDENVGGGGAVLDSGPLSINGTLSGNATSGPGRFGLGKLRAAIVTNPDFGAFDFQNSSFTIECWINTAPVGRTFTLVGRDDGSGTTNDFALQLFPSGGLQGYAIDTTGNLASVVMPGTTHSVDDGQWHDVAMVVDRSSGQIQIYADGQLQASANIPAGFGGIRNQGQTLKAGHFVNSGPVSFGGPLEFTGTLDEIRISASAHSATEIASDYLGQNGLQVTKVTPASIQQGTTGAPVTLTGFGLDGASVTSATTGVTVSSGLTTVTSIQLQVSVDATVPLGPVLLTVTDALGQSTTTSFTVVNQQPFANPPLGDTQTPVLWHLDDASGTRVTGSGDLVPTLVG